ncbi:hypothetical protein GKZ28_14040 [Clostridium chromiireducens]|uniref:Uncharacterized protein n=1 Tax=Clostridium chromiireducens TaxID=225345 RepID=A0A964RNN3_9CLOT|nr:hypothetical protein [Clostridium chromiireducens]MVX64815.1 hypothetical protein [Clostridium chromiireducens]
MKSECFIEGQISIFDLPAIEVVKPKKIIIEEENKEIDKFDSIIKLYSHSCSRIVKTLSGALLVELDDKTLYFNSDVVNEFNLPKDVGIMPGEEMLIVNIDKEINEIQRQKLKDLKPKQYIKRKGDANLIIPGEKTIVINPKGWILEYIQKPKFKENEIFETENYFINKAIEENIRESDIDYKVGNKVYIEYQGIKSIGEIVRIYNNGETLNIAWDGKQTAFYYKNVELVE